MTIARRSEWAKNVSEKKIAPRGIPHDKVMIESAAKRFCIFKVLVND